MLLISTNLFSKPLKEVFVTTEIYQNFDQRFYTYSGDGKYDSFLAMNIKYAPIKNLRSQIESALNLKLDYLKLLKPEGEAHITVITPIEFYDVLKNKLTIEDINKIARRYNIQSSKISIPQIGSAKKTVNGKETETFFIIADSDNLRHIRWQVYYEFVRRGGNKNAFDPAWFFPHITIGYIGRDLHESDGVLKNLKHSYDSRFSFIKKPSK